VKRKSTLRKLPPKTREIAKLLNQLESVSTRLANRLEAMAELEKNATAYKVMERMEGKEDKETHPFNCLRRRGTPSLFEACQSGGG
jgi:DNA repair exonuclease SbcCD ATPase subunit